MPSQPLTVGMVGEKVAALHEALSALGLSIPEAETKRRFFGPATREAVCECQKRHGLKVSGEVNESTAAALSTPVASSPPLSVAATSRSAMEAPFPLSSGGRKSMKPITPPLRDNDRGPEWDKVMFAVEGKIVSRERAGLGGLRVEIVDKNVGEDVRLVEAVTDDRGAYRATFSIATLHERGKQWPDLQARVFAGEIFLGASEVRYDASSRETLNVLLTSMAASALTSEHETLVGALSAHFRGSLRDLKETDDRQDISYLTNKTCWDARAVALAALADQFSARTVPAGGAGPAIAPAFFYALFRAGLPANEDALYQTDAKTAAGIWQRSIEQGVIPAALTDGIPKAVKHFQGLAAQRALDVPASAGVSPLKEMLSVSLVDDAEKQRLFADLYTRHRDDPPQFWDAVRGAFGEAAEKRLKLDGQLAYLTRNNASLIRKLHDAVGQNSLSDTVQLVEHGFSRAQKWQEAIGNDPVPPEIPGANAEEKRARYAELLSAKVRLSFPTAVVAHMVKSGETPLAAAPEVRDGVHAFLTEQHGKFEIGMQPVEQFITRNNLQIASEVIKEVKRIQRVYQITSDTAMNALLKKGLDSAYAVVRYDQAEFVETFKGELGGEAQARLAYAKAEQVHNAVLNIATSYLIASTAPGIGGHSPAQIVNPAPRGLDPQAANAGDVIAYPTLEGLFGEMDYCECAHCRSILSPAAYLVNLLQFIDPDPEAWASTMTRWKTEHDGAPYPFPDTTARNNAENPVDTEITPLQVLLSRRPDVQHLPLTCENTNTPLPYIDVVNETLEYFVTNSLTLDNYAGHSTDGDARPEELLASPQFVSDAAYATLKAEIFPPPLPFHQPLENLRRYFDRFEVPLPEVMEALRKDDSVERPKQSDYGWRDILMEELRLSRPEHKILTNYDRDPPLNKLTLRQLYGYAPATSEADVLAGLACAKAFTRRMGITYEELIEILKTRFINPSSTLIPKLERLGVPFSTLETLKESPLTGQAWLALLPQPLPDASHYGGNIETWVKDNANFAKIMGLITLTTPIVPRAASTAYRRGDCVRPTSLPAGAATFYECTTPGTSAAVEPGNWPTAPGQPFVDGTVVWTSRVGLSDCSLDTLRFRYADPAKLAQNIRGFEFVRMLRFIRLWKKLGWTIGQTDKAITALYPEVQLPNDPDDTVNLQRLDAGFLILLPRLGVIKHVMKALNLKPNQDLLPLLACFAPIDTHGAASLYRHMFLSPALLKLDAAFADDGFGNFLDGAETLTAHAETLRAAFLLTDAELSEIDTALGFDVNTPLTLDNISAVFRRGWLARKLKLSVREFLFLTTIKHQPVTTFTGIDPFAAPDPPSPQIRRLIELVSRLRAASLKPVEALYLIWNQDISGRSAPDERQMSDFARSLRAGFAAIESEFAIVDDPQGQIARARMTLVYGNEATDLFFGLLGNTVVTEVAYSHDQTTLEQAILDAAPAGIAYDDFRKRLSFRGVLTAAARDALKAVTGVTAQFSAAADSLFTENQQVVWSFFDRYPELLPLYEAYVASNDPVEQRRSDLLANFLPELKRRRKHQQALQVISATAKTDLRFTSAVLDDAAVLHAAANHTRPALDDLMAVETAGLSAEFFFRDTATGSVDRTSDVEANLTYSATRTNKLPANPVPGAISGIWSGYIEAPENGFFNLRIDADAGATVTLILDGTTANLAPNGTVWSNTAPIELRAGTLYAITLKVEKVKDTLSVRWESTGRGREIIAPRYLYSATLQDRLRVVYICFLKAASLASSLRLTAAETVHFASHADYRIGGQGWLNSLPVTGSPDNDTAIALLAAFSALLDFARIKGELAPDDERLLSILKDPAAATQSEDGLLLTLTRWTVDSLFTFLVIRFGKVIADLSHLDTFRRVYDAHAPVKTMGIPAAAALVKATTNEPNAVTVRNLQAALRARYDESGWLSVLKPINDEMRSLQRDALVTYILHQMSQKDETQHIDTPDKLFEYFLMDVQMDPCMQTSRIRHALSSVQLFIERCLMNLEPRVAPSSIKAKQWEWMQRYRVWEANRKVFLWPENWLEPELRDDQSPFFKETMSELLQSDITEDRAATALLNYLSKLEEVAKLEPCGIHYVENDPAADDGIAHVVARTAGANRKYFYRRREHGYWTPWEQIRVDIEDNPVIPVVWNGRLLLFWLRILKQAPLATPPPPPPGTQLWNLDASTYIRSDAPKVTVQAILCWSEYYNGKWQPTKTSDVNHPAELGQFHPTVFDRSELFLSVTEEQGYIHVSTWSNQALTSLGFVLFNTHSLPVVVRVSTLPELFRFVRIESDGRLGAVYEVPDVGSSFVRYILTNPMNGRVIQPIHALRNSWDAPFFYEDSRHVFYVTTRERIAQISQWNQFGIMPARVQPRLAIPPLVFEPEEVIPDRYGPIVTARNVGVVDRAPIERLVSEDARIDKVIGTTGTVRYGDKEIGPVGVVSNRQVRRG
ncbi:MAG: neuraminidase-like domain-containing protein [Chromatiales bacterium]